MNKENSFEKTYQGSAMQDLKSINAPTSNKENRAMFLERLQDMPEEVVESINFAYDLSKEAHRPQKRETGERYFEHPRSVALILMDECKIKDPDIISAALLHDSVEDSSMFAKTSRPYSRWRHVARFRLGKSFNPEVAEIVIALTKPQVDGEEIRLKDEAH